MILEANEKIIIFRGDDLDYSIRHVTETDSIQTKIAEIKQPKPTPVVRNIRSQEDIVVCYSTLSGNKKLIISNSFNI